MRVTIAQINTTNGDLKGNTQKIIQAIEEARSDGSDLVVFPEVVTHGYTSQDWFQDPDIIEHCEEPLREIIPETKGLTVVLGTIRNGTKTRAASSSTRAAVIHDGELLGFEDKTLLPEYDVFDDPRYFEPSPERRIFEVNGVTLGVVVCEDFWNDKTFWAERLYEYDPDGRGHRSWAPTSSSRSTLRRITRARSSSAATWSLTVRSCKKSRSFL